ncbi:GNAT family N-acetyltransferase [Aestuariispira insulae]|uniref:Acetyltransferase (GNAT) family protein n=1 Tax=Aestuariispira insulae TaxID=1461337 RepID=A0A3D9HAY3_9PROT|nr:GNAT family N-acetyltransferase [Aestuariispira insulae]RED46146.1 acetyltransferase (GNAT) family protein [Aestuariispira insulae]
MLRPLTPADAAIYRRNRLRARKDEPQAFGADYAEEARKPLDFFIRRLSPGADWLTLGYWELDDLIASGILMRQEKKKCRHKASIFGVYVSPHARGRGLSRILMNGLMEQAGAMGVSHLYLTVTAENEAAKGLYESLGFEAYGREPAALKVGDRLIDEVLMAKVL